MTHRIELPRYIIRGERVFDDVAKVAGELKKKSVLVVADRITYGLAGEVVERRLGAENVLVNGASREEAERVRGIIEKKSHDLAVAVGGGSVIDVTKVASDEADIPFFSLPTTISHDGIASGGASLLVNGRKMSIPSRVPMAVFADLELIEAAPYRLFAAGCGDAISKFTAVLDWKLAHRLKGEYYGGYAAQLAELAAQSIITNHEKMAENKKFGVHILFESLISSGVAMSIAGSSRPASGAEHSFSHALDKVAPKPALHGEQVGVGTIMMAHLHGRNFRMIRKVLSTLGAPTTAAELGIDEEYIIKALTIAHKIRDRYTILGDGLTEDAAKKLAEETKVI